MTASVFASTYSSVLVSLLLDAAPGAVLDPGESTAACSFNSFKFEVAGAASASAFVRA